MVKVQSYTGPSLIIINHLAVGTIGNPWELPPLPSRNYCQPVIARRDNFAVPVNNRVLLSSDILRGAPY
jgi:hypothetical protein